MSPILPLNSISLPREYRPLSFNVLRTCVSSVMNAFWRQIPDIPLTFQNSHWPTNRFVAVVYSVIGRRDHAIQAGDADVMGDIIYTGCTVGRDGTGEFFRATFRVDHNWLSPAY